ncbi:stalk domain-containing protein [Paenibacillus harenae]|uniref:stalk domain-containing protein n=1 Tax=Paenibacillus harenae TaxID=306543 RepID=UPI0004158389|nr:stalk domain-containing protein [Paenibacillus harenae]
MSNYNNLFKKMITLLLPALLILSMMPIAVFASGTAEKVEIRLKAGSPTVKINGTASTVIAPFVTAGTTMVPLKVITNAFGAGLKLENGNIITLTYNDRKVVLTFGSKSVKVNGAVKTVAVAPVVLKGSTMVPLRVIVEAFGAAITVDQATKETVITGSRAQLSDAGGTSIDADFNKTKVGDSYYGWSMNYPAGLVQVMQSDSGDYVKWADAKEAAQVIVITEHTGDSELTSEEQRDMLNGYFEGDEYTVDERTISVGGLSFEKLVTYTKQDKTHYEYRGIQQGENFYIVIVGAQGADKSVLKNYDVLLNSFKPSFNATDKAVKDITKVVNGVITFKDVDFGLTVKLPTGWYNDNKSAKPAYYSENESLYFSLSSAVEGDTLEKWAARREADIRDDFASNYVRGITTSPLKLQDGNALVLSYEYTYDLKNWIKGNEVLLIAGNYRYSIDFYYDLFNGSKGNEIYNSAMASLDIDTAYIEKNFDQVENDYDFVDRSKKVTKRSSMYGYSIEIPAYWYGVQNNFNEDEVYYSFSGGEMTIYAAEGNASSILADITAYTRSAEAAEVGTTLKESTMIQVNGKMVYKFVGHTAEPDEGMPYSEIFYIADTANGPLVYYFVLYDANATPSNVQRINDTVQSIRFN